MMGYTVQERTTREYTATILDEKSAVIPGGSLSTLALTLYDLATDAIINGRDGQDVLNANDVEVDEQGLLTWVMQPEDNAVLDDSLAQEVHVALFEWTYDSGKRGQHEIEFLVRNSRRVQ